MQEEPQLNPLIPDHEASLSVQKTKKTWIVIVGLIILAIIVGIATYLVQDMRMDKKIAEVEEKNKQEATVSSNLEAENKALGEKITVLEQEIEQLNKENQKREEELTKSSNFTMFSDEKLKVSFEYPKEWGLIYPQDDIFEMDGEKSYLARLLLFGTFGSSTFYVGNNPNEESLGRGGYWGDSGRAIESERDVITFCKGKENCSTFKNDNGVLIAKHVVEVCTEGGCSDMKTPQYYYYNPISVYSGVVLSPYLFMNEINLDDFDAMIQTINIIN